jgi:hypothetical protein
MRAPRTRRRPVSVSCDGAQLSGSWGVGGAPRNAVCAKIGIAGVAGLQVAGLCQHSLFFQKKKREAPRRRESRSPLLDCWHSPRTMSDDSYLATPMSSLSVAPGQRRRRPVTSLGSSASPSNPHAPRRRLDDSSSIASSFMLSDGMASNGSIGQGSSSPTSTPGSSQSSTAGVIAPARPNSVDEFICTTRLAAASALFARGSLEEKKCSVLLAACKNIMSAERWFAAVPARGDCPPALAGQQIGEVSVTYTPRHAIPKQRRYADGPCIFKLPKKARFAAAHGLYVDGDLVGSELVSLQHACHMHRCDCSLMRSECPMAL